MVVLSQARSPPYIPPPTPTPTPPPPPPPPSTLVAQPEELVAQPLNAAQPNAQPDDHKLVDAMVRVVGEVKERVRKARQFDDIDINIDIIDGKCAQSTTVA